MNYRSQLMIRVVVAAALVVGTITCSGAQAADANFYVATNGNDTWSGRLPAPNAAGTDGPFATLTRARDAIRELKVAEGLRQPLKVLVRGGTYYLSETLIFGPQDSGTASFPITYMAYAGEKPILSGGRVITGPRGPKPATAGESAWKPYQGQIWQCDLKALGIGELPRKQLFYNGERQPMARFPNLEPQRPRTGGFLYVFQGGVKGSKNLLRYDPAKLDPSRWAKPTLVEVNVFPYHNWNNIIIPITEIDQANHIIALASDANYQLIRDTRFYIQNAFEELDAPGEWYVDDEAGTLYFWPPDDNLARSQVVISVVGNMIDIRRDGDKNAAVRHLRIGGFALQDCWGDAIILRHAQHCTIAKCTITNVGAGVSIGSSNNRVVGNDIAYTRSHGILTFGRENIVSNNHIHHVGVIMKARFPIIAAGQANVVSHNLLHDAPTWGIDFYGHDNVIEYNEIHHFGLETNLAGGIYAFGDAEATKDRVGGITIRFNKVTDSVGYGMISPGEWAYNGGTGIWLDGRYVSDNTIYGNICVRNKCMGVDIHGGQNNIIENNIMGAGIPSTINHVRPGDEPCNNKILRNIVYYANADPRLLLQYGWTMRGITETAASAAAIPVFLCGWSSVKAAVAESDYNLFFSIRGKDVRTLLYFRGAGEAFYGPWADEPVEDRFAWWWSQGYEAHSIIADPLFVDAAQGDFRLKPESPAFKLGFKPIPTDRIGLYPSPNRASWPPAEHWNIWREGLEESGPPKPKPRPQFNARQDTTGIIVDGDVGEWPWSDAAGMVVLQQAGSGEASPAPKSYACAAYDDEALYIAIRNLVQDPKALKTKGVWGAKDGLEVAFQDVSGDELGPILNLYGYPDGQFESVTEAGAPREVATKLGNAVTYAAQIGTDYWACEWRIPWMATGIDLHKVKKLWFNVGVRKIAADAWVVWKGTGATIYWLDNAGNLILRP